MPQPFRRIAATLCVALGVASLSAPVAAGAAPDAPCGSTEGICHVGDGFYRLAIPGDAADGVPAVLFLHGWNASSSGVMANAPLRQVLEARGYALIAPEGVPQGAGRPLDWGVRDMSGRSARNDLAFLAAVLDDAARRGIDRGRVLLAGFSRGASMVWDAACLAPGIARGYAPIAGAFWEPLPDDCKGPVNLFHTHGWSDRVIPLEGRILGEGRLIQGDAFASLAILRDMTGCRARMADEMPLERESGLWLRHWTNCPGGRLDLMLHPGGHMIPKGWAERALDWFEALDD